jgi:ubiquinone/menaquinone biosynthesis C-methylase UbiE
MNPEEYERMHALETNYWWFVGRRRLVAHLLKATLKKVPASPSGPVLIDIGCGTGANLPVLRETLGKKGRVFGLDFSPHALKFASAYLNNHLHVEGVSLSQGDALALPLADECADVVTMMDVLEHLSDDDLALQEVHRILKPGGALVLTVPAYQHLWSAHDEALHHFRRYEKIGLNSVLRNAGFSIWRLSFAMSLMPPIAWAWRKIVLPLQPKRPQDATRHSQGAILPTVPAWGNQMLVNYVAAEGRILLNRPLKFGTTLVAVVFKS